MSKRVHSLKIGKVSNGVRMDNSQVDRDVEVIPQGDNARKNYIGVWTAK